MSLILRFPSDKNPDGSKGWGNEGPFCAWSEDGVWTAAGRIPLSWGVFPWADGRYGEPKPKPKSLGSEGL